MTKNRLNLLGLVTGAIMISFSGVWVKISHVTPTVSAFYRVFFGGVILLVMALVRREVKWRGKQNALPGIRASLSGLILLLQPALAFVWDVLLFQRPTTLVNWLGVVLALAAIYLGTVKTSKQS